MTRHDCPGCPFGVQPIHVPSLFKSCFQDMYSINIMYSINNRNRTRANGWDVLSTVLSGVPSINSFNIYSNPAI